MSTPSPARGRVAVLGAGPAGLAAALGILKAGHDVVLYERYREARPAGNILNLWPPPLKALRALGVDISDFGAPTDSEFRSISGRVRVRVKIDPDVKRDYGGGFIGLLRPELYARMLAAIPPGCGRRHQPEGDQQAAGPHRGLSRAAAGRGLSRAAAGPLLAVISCYLPRPPRRAPTGR